MYIHERKEWPKFVYDQEKISVLLLRVKREQAILLHAMRTLGFHERDETVLENLTKDVVKSSEIEGEILDESQVRSSVARHLGMDIAGLDVHDKNIDGVVSMVIDATQNFSQPLTKERLFSWHKSLFPSGKSGWSKICVGEWRKDSVQVVSGKIGDETIHYEAPSQDRVEHEMKIFLEWIQAPKEMDLIEQAAIAHLWFVTVHPFDDGNGRIGRAIADLLLARSEKSSYRFYSLSKQIRLERKSYYSILEKTQKGTLDITLWIEWFLHCLEKAFQVALTTLDTVVIKAKFWQSQSGIFFNERQRKVLNRMLDGFLGNMTSSKWAKIAKCSQDTAYRDILDLLERKILRKNEKEGRSTSYSINIS